MRVVVIGIGNPYRRDDGVGLAVAERVRSSVGPEVLVAEHDGEPIGLIDLWDGAALAIVVDAFRSHAEPGTVHWVAVGDGPIPSRPMRDSTHAVGLAETVDLARALGRLPRHLVLVGIEPADVGDGTGLTSAAEAAIPKAARMIVDRIAAGA